MSDIQETLEVEAAVNLVAQKLIVALKAGKNLGAALLEIAMDSDIQSAVMKAVDGAAKVPEELKSIDLAGGIQLAEKVAEDIVADIKA